MKRLIQKIREIWSIEELRNRILFTLALLAIYRFGSHVVLPGVDGGKVAASMSNSGSGLLGLINTFTGGSFLGATVLALGIMPYISASIIVQLLAFAVPSFQKMQKEGESGQRKMNQITRVIAVGLTMAQAFFYVNNFIMVTYRDAVTTAVSPGLFLIGSMFVITAGTILCMWLGERITDRGIGNGTSLIIAIGIVARLPQAIFSELDYRFSGAGGLVVFAVEIALLVLVTIGTILLIQAVRKIPIQQAKAETARATRAVPGEGSRDYLPIKLNAAGVMPVIFAQALMFLPGTIIQAVSGEKAGAMGGLMDYKSFSYNTVYFLFIIIFTYVYTALVINPQQQAEYLKQRNAFIPGVKPGQDTSDFIDAVASRITLPGAIALGLVAILPSLAGTLGVKDAFAYFFGGTSLIIMVGVVLDTLAQIENYLLAKQYDSLIHGTRVRGRGQATFDTSMQES